MRGSSCEAFLVLVLLATATPPSAALCEYRSHDGSSTSETVVAVPAVDTELVLKSALEPFGVDLIVDAGPTLFDRAPGDGRNRTPKTGRPFPRGGPGGTTRVNPRLPERFAGIDVADPRNATLVEQEHLDRCRSPIQQAGKPLERENVREGLQTDLGSPRFFRSDKAHPAELPDVRERESAFVVERQQNVRVGLGIRGPRRPDDETPGHPEMNDERSPGPERDDHELAAPADGVYRLPGQLSDEAFGLRRDDFGKGDSH